MTCTYFSEDSYRCILTRARERGYRLIPFEDFREPHIDGSPVLVLRHDLDHSIRSGAHIARLEADEGVRSTYFVQVASDFYNLLSSESRRLLQQMVEQGHEIGLHYDSTRYAGPDGREQARFDLALLEDVCGRPIRSASQHIPIDSPTFDILDLVDNEAYEPRFMDGEMTYISDSLMAWRQATPHDLLKAGCPFQLLTHPIQWARDVDTMDEALSGALREECAWLRQRYDEVSDYYDKLLAERAERDAKFQERRAARRDTTSSSG